MDGLPLVILVAGAAALASPIGGALGLKLGQDSLRLSLAVGLAAGVLLGAFAFEMMPQALEDAGPWAAALGFGAGLLVVYGLDLVVNRGRLAGPEADQQPAVERFHRRHRPWGAPSTVLAIGTATEEVIEGLTIGVGLVIDPALGGVIALSIGFDNIAEGMSLAKLAREEHGDKAARWTMIWTSVIGASLFLSAVAGGALLTSLPPIWLGVMLAAGAGGMFYLTVSELSPESQARQYQQSAGLAMACGFLTVFLLSGLN